MLCRFMVSSVKKTVGPDGSVQQEEIEARAVCKDSCNKDWSKWTPYGLLQLHVSNPACFDVLRPGMEVDVQIMPVSASQEKQL